MLTKNDLAQIKILMNLLLVSNNSILYKRFDEMAEDLEKIKDQIKYLPTKDEYFDSMDKLMKEVLDSRETQEISGSQLSDHTDKLENHEVRIVKIEKKTFAVA